jgi:hypothetical protein
MKHHPEIIEMLRNTVAHIDQVHDYLVQLSAKEMAAIRREISKLNPNEGTGCGLLLSFLCPTESEEAAMFRGEPFEVEQLWHIAGLSEATANKKPTGRLLRLLHEQHKFWRSVHYLSGGKGGDAHKTVKEKLCELAGVLLAECDSQTGLWRLGEAAYSDKRATKHAVSKTNEPPPLFIIRRIKTTISAKKW